MPHKIFRLFTLTALVCGLCSCASVSVTDLHSTTKSRAPRSLPPHIVVEPFSTPDSAFRVDRQGPELKTLQNGLATTLASMTAERLTKHVAPATVSNKSKNRPQNGWLVRGRFVKVNQGSRALRIIFGFGSGGTKLETEVEVLDLARPQSKPFLRFRTTGGSNAEPGAITGLIATGPIDLGVGVAVAALSVSSHGLTEDTWRTSREITAQLSAYSASRGFIAKERALEPKKLAADTPTQPHRLPPTKGR